MANFATLMRFKQWLDEAVVYKNNPIQNAKNEHDETTHQSDAIKRGGMSAHPAIARAIHNFAKNPQSFTRAVATSKIEKIKAGTKINNSDIGSKTNGLNRDKITRVKRQINSGQVHHPIILRHVDSEGNVHHHLLAGNTRATAVGYGVKARFVNVN